MRGRSRLSLLGLLILITLLSGGCRSWRPDPPPPSSAFGSAGRRLDTPTDRVIVVSIDGLRPDAISRYGLSTLSHLVEWGAYSLEARTIYPSKTLPSHTSMLTGVPPEVHGIAWNEDRTRSEGLVGVPTLFEVARAQGLKTAAFFAKSKFRHLQRPRSLDHSEAPLGYEFLMAPEVVEAATRYLRYEKPDLLFVHIAEPDYAGHLVGWMSWLYRLGARRADAAVRRIIEEAEVVYGQGGFTLIVTADHGGHGRSHGSDDPRDMTIPWIAWGQGVVPGELVVDSIRTMDTAATVLWLLGVDIPADWAGRPVYRAFGVSRPGELPARELPGLPARSLTSHIDVEEGTPN